MSSWNLITLIIFKKKSNLLVLGLTWSTPSDADTLLIMVYVISLKVQNSWGLVGLRREYHQREPLKELVHLEVQISMKRYLLVIPVIRDWMGWIWWSRELVHKNIDVSHLGNFFSFLYCTDNWIYFLKCASQNIINN